MSAFPWVQLRYVSRTGTGHTPSRTKPELWVEDERVIPWITLADVGRIRNGTVDVLDQTAERISQAGIDASSAVVHPRGTVVLSRTASVGFSAIMGTAMAVSQDFMTWTPGPRLHGGFLLHYLRGFRPMLLGLMHGSTHKTIYMPDLLALKVPLPSLQQQQAIVDFLDREASRIRSLKDELAATASVLKEDLSGLFLRLVGQHGAPANAPLRRFIQSITDGPFGSSLASAHYVDAPEVRVVRLGNVGLAEFRAGDPAYVSAGYAHAGLRAHFLDPGDVVLAGLGDANNPLGRACVVPSSLGPAIHKADCYRVRVDPARCLPEYLAVALSFGNARDEAPLLSRGATRSRLNTVLARELPVPALPLERQARVVDSFTKRRRAYNLLDHELAILTGHLEEYRDALITEAVTGRLDVTTLSESQMAESLAAVREGERPEVLST